MTAISLWTEVFSSVMCVVVMCCSYGEVLELQFNIIFLITAIISIS